MDIRKYRGKPEESSEFIFGFLSGNEDEYFIGQHGGNYEFIKVIPESIGQSIGLETKSREVYDGDIFFAEVENDEGDERHYFVVKWLQNKCSFVFMDYGDTVTNWDTFEENIWNEYPTQVTQEELDSMFYAGNYYDNPEFLTKGLGDEEE